MAYTFESFKAKILVPELKDKFGNRKHTRLTKHLFEKFAAEIKDEFGIDFHSCAHCGIGKHWNGKPLVLDMDHINGVWWDSRPENIRFLCPNCHSQTPTYKRKKS